MRGSGPVDSRLTNSLIRAIHSVLFAAHSHPPPAITQDTGWSSPLHQYTGHTSHTWDGRLSVQDSAPTITMVQLSVQ
jgi:hypothetical protein